jgi:pantoate--beta-alanine ligase
MGALHEGHLALVDAARARADFVVVSIYVNPTQFNAGADLAAYPRTLEADLAACEARGVDAVFLPSDDQLYPEGAETWVDLTEITKPLEGASRPGHFRGVATVVTKLFVAAKPNVACFGEKDYQQLALIRRMTGDLGFDIEILGVATVREADGLALSSRNVRLSEDARSQAHVIARALDAAESAVTAGETRGDAILHLVRTELAKAPLGELDYAELRTADALAPVDVVLSGSTLLALAVNFPGSDGQPVRLIDNRVLEPSPS